MGGVIKDKILQDEFDIDLDVHVMSDLLKIPVNATKAKGCMISVSGAPV